MRPAAFLMMGMVANLVKQAVGIRILAAAGLADVGAARNHVKEMRDDTGSQERLPVCVEVEAPGVAGAFGKDLELACREAVTPHGGIHLHFADFGMGEDAVQTVERAIRAPLQGV